MLTTSHESTTAVSEAAVSVASSRKAAVDARWSAATTAIKLMTLDTTRIERAAARLSSSRVATCVVARASSRPISSQIHSNSKVAVVIQPTSRANCQGATSRSEPAVTTPPTAQATTRRRSELPDNFMRNPTGSEAEKQAGPDAIGAAHGPRS